MVHVVIQNIFRGVGGGGGEGGVSYCASLCC